MLYGRTATLWNEMVYLLRVIEDLFAKRINSDLCDLLVSFFFVFFRRQHWGREFYLLRVIEDLVDFYKQVI